MNHEDYNAHQTMSAMRARRLTRNDEWIPHMRLQLDTARAAKRSVKLRRLAWAALAVIGALTILYVLNGSKQDAVQSQAQYCSMVHAGAWPDYDHTYVQACNADGTVNMKYVNGY